MSSWSSMHGAPPRSERSRSPPRGAYGRPPYPDPYTDPYREHWDAYNRDRAWADYERDRGYDYGRRGRSRSPAPDEPGRKRRRSVSPYDRERYDPRPRYEDYDGYRGHGQSPVRGRGSYGSYGSRSGRGIPPQDPHTMDYPASLKQFAEWFRYYYPQQASEEDMADKAAEQEAGDGSKPRNGIKTRWEKYKKEFLAQQLQTLFDHHRKSPWFAEKYDPAPEYANLRSRVRKVGWRGRMNQFLNELEDGKFDSNVNANDNEIEPTSPTSPSLKENEGSVAENGSAVKPEDASPAKEDEFGMALDGDEEAADNAVDLRGDTNGKVISEPDGRRPDTSGSKDEVSVEPEGNQVMIRTIPPDIGRMKLEAAIKDIPGFVYLALGDPMQKRNYYRAGWIKFTEDADMPKVLTTLSEKKIEGFKLHVTHNTRAFTSKVRYAPEVASRPDRIAKDLEQAKKLVSILEDEYERVRKFKIEKPVKDSSAGGAATDDAIENKETESVMTQPEEDVLMADAMVEDEVPRERGSEAVERHIEKLVSEIPELTSEAEKQAYETKKNTIALDLYLAYLRAAFHTCFYCVSVSDNAEELQRKCIKHVRKPLSKTLAAEVAAQVEAKMKVDGKEGKEEKSEEGKEGEAAEGEKEKDKKESTSKDKESRDWKRNDERWLDWLDNRLALLIDRDTIDVRDYGGKRYEDELTKAVEPHVKQEDEGKYRCKTCSKLFKAPSFVEKHVVNKHPELVKSLEDIPYYNNFALDPQRIQPFTHYPQPVGTTQPPPPQAYGLQGPPQAYPEYMRGTAPPVPNPYYGAYPPYPPYPPPMDPYGYPPPQGQYYTYPPPMPVPQRSLRDEPPLGAGRGNGGRLSDRIGGFAPGLEDSSRAQGSPHGIEGLPAKPVGSLDASAAARRNGRGPAPPPPPDAREDPRAAAGRKVSYHDMDLVAEGDVELQY